MYRNLFAGNYIQWAFLRSLGYTKTNIPPIAESVTMFRYDGTARSGKAPPPARGFGAAVAADASLSTYIPRSMSLLFENLAFVSLISTIQTINLGTRLDRVTSRSGRARRHLHVRVQGANHDVETQAYWILFLLFLLLLLFLSPSKSLERQSSI